MKIENLEKAANLQKKIVEIDHMLEVMPKYDEILLVDNDDNYGDLVFPYGFSPKVKKLLKDIANEHRDELLKKVEELD